MLNIVALYFSQHHNREEHGERDFWRDWGPTYVRRLFAGVDRHMPRLTLYRKYLYTDTPEAAPPGVKVLPIPDVFAGSPGWWKKLAVFSEALVGTTLYLDLDNVVCGDLGPILALTPDPLIMLDDRAYPRLPNGAAMLFDPARMRPWLDSYLLHPEGWHNRFREWPEASDQAYTAHLFRKLHQGAEPPLMQDLVPPGTILNARVELEPRRDWPGCRLVYGSYSPKPHESRHPFYAEHWRDE